MIKKYIKMILEKQDFQVKNVLSSLENEIKSILPENIPVARNSKRGIIFFINKKIDSIIEIPFLPTDNMKNYMKLPERSTINDVVNMLEGKETDEKIK